MRDVAELARVSVQTVSNVVNGRLDEMSAQTQERVFAALAQLGYRTNVAAASLRSQRIRTLAFLVLDEHAGFLADPLTDQLLAGVADVARERRYGVLMHGSRPGELDGEFLRPLREGRADGAVIQLSGPRALRRGYIDEARALGVSVVVIDETGLPPGVLGVRAHQWRGARTLTEHLLDRGHRRVAFVGARVPWAVVEQRVSGYRAALRARGIVPREDLVLLEAGYHAADGEGLAARLLGTRRPPTAILCGSDLLAAGVLHAVKAAGLRVPADIAVAGFDDFEFSRYLDPPLTTVRVPAYEMGTRAAELLIAAVEGAGTAKAPPVFATSLVVRASA
jgi:DNA-binding LacI/PurR family transcriptional regulator